MASVDAGMELVRWQYTPDEWRRYYARRAAAFLVDESTPRYCRRKAATIAVALAGYLVTFGILFATESLAVFTVGLFVVAVAAIATWRFVEPTEPPMPPVPREPPEVLFTSTGFRFGDTDQLWRDPENRLHLVRFLEDGTPRLEITFERGPVIHIPVPEAFQSQARGFTKELQRLVARRGE